MRLTCRRSPKFSIARHSYFANLVPLLRVEEGAQRGQVTPPQIHSQFPLQHKPPQGYPDLESRVTWRRGKKKCALGMYGQWEVPCDRNRGSQKSRQEHSQGNMTRSRSLPGTPTVCDLTELRAGSQHLLLSSGVGFQKVVSDQHVIRGSSGLPNSETLSPWLRNPSIQYQLATQGRYSTFRESFLWLQALSPIVFNTHYSEGTTTHPSILACRIPWTEESGGLQSMGSQRVGHDWSDLAHNITWQHWLWQFAAQ